MGDVFSHLCGEGINDRAVHDECIKMTFNLSMNSEVIKFIVSTITPFLAGWMGLKFGLRQLKEERRLAFIEKQLNEFYSPLLGMHKVIREKSILRLKISKAGDKGWKENVHNGQNPSIEPIKDEIAYDNRQLMEEFIPTYKKMLDIFRDQYWLAEPTTRCFFGDFVEYVEIWNRFIKRGVSMISLEGIGGHHEEKLQPFYDELEHQTAILSKQIAQKY